jgi:uncharacterized protein YndB with AHSA1/START domain
LDKIQFSRAMSASSDMIWRVITTPEDIASWLGARVQLQLLAGGLFSGQCHSDNNVPALSRPRSWSGRVIAATERSELSIQLWNDATCHPAITWKWTLANRASGQVLSLEVAVDATLDRFQDVDQHIWMEALDRIDAMTRRVTRSDHTKSVGTGPTSQT